MSERLKSFDKLSPWNPKGKLDALAARVDALLDPLDRVGPFPAAPPGYPDADIWDPERHYYVGETAYAASGAYFRCVADAPAGTALTDNRSWTYHMPNWINHMNVVRDALAVRWWTAAVALGCGPGATLLENSIVSGPWEIPASASAASELLDGRSGILLTRLFESRDVDGHFAEVQPYGFTNLELLSPDAGARLDLAAAFRPRGCEYVIAYPDGHWGYRLRISLGTGAYVYGAITCEVDAVAPFVIHSNKTSTTDEIRWDFNGFMTEIYCEIEAYGIQETEGGPWGYVNRITGAGDYDIIGVTWAGSAGVEAHNVIGNQTIYRSLPVSPMPRCRQSKWNLQEDGSLVESPYADGVNVLEIYAQPAVWASAGVPAYRMRGKTLPANNIHYSIGPVGSGNLLEQREWYPCLPVADTRTIPLRYPQTLVQEIDTLWAHRALSEADQSVPVVSLTESAVTRAALSEDVGYRRPSDAASVLRALTTVSIPTNQMRVEKYLGRSNAIIVWDGPYPMRWTGTALWVEANTLLGVDPPCHANGWVWTTGVSLGWFYVASSALDDLNAIMDQM